MIDWIKQHPILAGTGVIGLILLFLVIRRKSASPVQSVGPSEALQAAALSAQVQQSNAVAAQNVQTNQLNAALQAKLIDQQTAQYLADASVHAADLTAHADVAKIQAEAGGAADIAQTQGLYSLLTTTRQAGAAMDIARTQATRDVTIASTQADRDVTIAGIQGDVTKQQFDDALKATDLTSRASVQINSQNTQRDIALGNFAMTAAINATAAKAATDQDSIAANLAALQDTNHTAITINSQNTTRDVDIQKIIADNSATLAGISASTELAKIDATHDTYIHFLDEQGATDLAAIQAQVTASNNQTSVADRLLALVQSGQINKGGEGGKNQVSVIAALTGQTNIGVAAQQPQPSVLGQFLAGLGFGLGKGATAAVAP